MFRMFFAKRTEKALIARIETVKSEIEDTKRIARDRLAIAIAKLDAETAKQAAAPDHMKHHYNSGILAQEWIVYQLRGLAA